MRGDLDSSKFYDINWRSGRWSLSRKALNGEYQVVDGGTVVHFLDPNGANRDVRLPPLGEGKIFLISHVGTANDLNVITANGVAVSTLHFDESMFVVADEVEWITFKAPSWLDLEDFGIAGPLHHRGLVPDPGVTPNPDPSHRKYLSELGWAEITEISGDDFYKYFKGGATTLTPLGADTLEFVSANNMLTILANAATTPDSVNFTINVGNIDHNLLLNYVADQHVAHSGVTLTAGIGLAGGGTIASSRTFDLDLNDLTTDTPVLADFFAFYDVSGADTNKATLTTLNSILDHNALLNFVANKHIDHSTVTITGATGISGGGDLTASRVLSLDINGLTVDTIATGDFFAFFDISGGDTNKISLANLNAALDHNALANYVADQHVAHSGVTLTAGNGLTGGGTIAASRTFDVGAGTGISVAADSVGLDTTHVRNVDHSAVSISTTEGIQGGGDISATRTLKLDINTLTLDSTPDAANDFLATWDASASLHKKTSINNIKAQLGGLNTGNIQFVIDGAGATITTGLKGFLEVPFACTITVATLLADQSGSIVVNVWKDTYANFPPTVADKITASAPPTITTATKSQDSTLTGWTTSVAAGDILAFNVDSVTTIQRVTISLKVTKT